ncbi:MAG TPA: cytochrome c biogenesis CcdA family protein [Candidatus Dormibacteraeota bacterium]|nr:cytochrome c biogenesis CcdA family protein [Candidatus Dormibacteraeota bacterium]
MVGLPTLIATFVAGLGSFLNPCSLPLLPAYLSYAGGVSAADLADPQRRERHRGRLVGGTLLFVAGFSTVFVLLGIGAGGLGRQVRAVERPVEIAGGAAMVLLGLALAGVLRAGVLERGRRLELPARLRGAGLWSAYPFGAVFAIGWTPCVGPYLASALTLAAVSTHVGSGAVLLAAYALGLGLPFVIAALVYASLPDMGRRLSRFAVPAARIGGLLVAALGVLLLSGQYSRLTSLLASLSVPHGG